MDRRRRVRHNLSFGDDRESAARAGAELLCRQRREPWIYEQVRGFDEAGAIFHVTVWLVQRTSPRAWEEARAEIADVAKRHGGNYLGCEDTWPWRRSGYWRARRRRPRPSWPA